jgi:hypothetical protein
MNTSFHLILVTTGLMACLTTHAQRNHAGTQNSHPNNSSTSANSGSKHGWPSNTYHGPNGGGNVIVHFGGYPNPNYNPYGYNNFYNVRKASRNSIRQSASIIRQALQFGDWHDIYSPWLAKAIRHQHYAKQLYFWGDYAGALNHAERAGFLAWNTLDYFNHSYNYSYSNYPDPYSNPNNPYYRPGSSNVPNNNPVEDDMSFRKGTTEKNSNVAKTESGKLKNENPNANHDIELDQTLPQNKMSDREILKTNTKELDIE